MVAIGHAYAVFFNAFHRQTCRKRLRVNTKAPVVNRGMTYQSDGKDLTRATEYFVGGGGGSTSMLLFI